MSAIPKAAGFSFKVDGNPFQASQPPQPTPEQPFDITKLPPELQEAIAKAYGTKPPPQIAGWLPSKAPEVKFNATEADGKGNVSVNWPPSSNQQAAQQQQQQPQAAPTNMPQWIANQFGGAPVQQQQQQQQATFPNNSGRPRVMICICSPPLVDTRFASMMMRLATLAAVAGCEWGWMCDWRYGLAETRMSMIVHAMNIPGVTHVMFLDADMIIKGDDALAFLLQDNVPLVSGLYWNSLGSGVAAWVGGSTIGLQQQSNCLPVDQIGMGCCLIQTQLFQALKQAGAPWPWFYYHVDADKPRNFYGEDFHFQELCADQRIGVKPYVDFRVKADHIKATVYEYDGKMHMQDYG